MRRCHPQWMGGSSPRVRGKPRRALVGGAVGRLIPARAGKTLSGFDTRPFVAAHPRACGENRFRQMSTGYSDGSSPRVRGKRGAAAVVPGHPRLIPARAGKTLPFVWCLVDCAAHPRACGENYPPAHLAAAAAGSSPRVRGKPRPVDAGDVPEGLIPARAGKTGPRTPTLGAGPAHPRACGENYPQRPASHVVEGSSPRVRGKHPHACRPPQPSRLIPARAGKTPYFPGNETATPGSSPRVRGKQVAACAGDPVGGLIPARAGKTAARSAHGSPRTAHPRACGENTLVRADDPDGAGSSPRVRGKRQTEARRLCANGLIPARAGKTWSPRARSASTTAHPRACGENQRTLRYPRHQAGSSPRVRGKQFDGPFASGPSGLIPARAGKTGCEAP